jgi:hypothetical protein
MKTVVAYTRVVATAKEQSSPASGYDMGTERFLRTYDQFKPEEDHQLVIIDCGGAATFNYTFRSLEYYGNGWDCGAYQFAADAIDCDLLVCCNAWTYFWRFDWLRLLQKAYVEHGPGIYGVSASFERGPHLRTPCFAIATELLREYPIHVKDRYSCNSFEASEHSITRFVQRLGKPAMLVTADGSNWVQPNWRAASNIFRRGDQSNVLVWDRHTDLYRDSDSDYKRQLELVADNL